MDKKVMEASYEDLKFINKEGPKKLIEISQKFNEHQLMFVAEKASFLGREEEYIKIVNTCKRGGKYWYIFMPIVMLTFSLIYPKLAYFLEQYIDITYIRGATGACLGVGFCSIYSFGKSVEMYYSKLRKKPIKDIIEEKIEINKEIMEELERRILDDQKVIEKIVKENSKEETKK